MKLGALRPMLWTSQLKETVNFYTDTLGFTCAEFNEDWGWAAVHRDDIEIMFAVPNEHTPYERPIFTGSFYILVEPVEEMWEILKDKAEIAYPIENFEYGMREFAIYDINGYMLQFGQDIATLSN